MQLFHHAVHHACIPHTSSRITSEACESKKRWASSLSWDENIGLVRQLIWWNVVVSTIIIVIMETNDFIYVEDT